VTERDAFDERPTAEQMLARVQSEAGGSRGRLRVYVGMAPGVGKTYRMLEEAHRRVDRGTDLAVGFVETHGRARTASLLEGLEIVPRLRVEYRGIVVEEMDTQAVIERHPVVAVIDELAHTNVPGSVRAKRWQDIDLIRDQGIHVISTCNVQHVESLADAVATITGAPVHERIPDEVLAAADEIELVDMSPHALRQRMRHGNVYPPEQVRIALDRFFTEPNLTALRELALRLVARQVDVELEDLTLAQSREALRSVSEHIVVLLDATVAGRSAVRRAATLASALRAPMLAVLVEHEGREQLAVEQRRNLQENVAYAEDLGAEIVRAAAASTVDALIDVARRRRATHVVLAHHRRRGLAERLQPTMGELVLERLPHVEVHLVAEAPDRG
jgi:two-component system, OmpR family, sensor histidine kinase KdpD